jgi:hypothetical protein
LHGREARGPREGGGGGSPHPSLNLYSGKDPEFVMNELINNLIVVRIHPLSHEDEFFGIRPGILNVESENINLFGFIILVFRTFLVVIDEFGLEILNEDVEVFVLPDELDVRIH